MSLRQKSLLLLIVLLLAGCASNKSQLTLDEKMAQADALYAQKKYAKAAELYDDITFEKKSANAPTALMRQADCYYQIHKFSDARLKYTLMTTTYPDFADIELAFFRIGECYYEESRPAQYDQTETAQCIEAFRTFIEKFPNSKYYMDAINYIRKAQYKLLQKKYYNGYIYYRMKDYSSALLYFEDIITLSNQDELDRKSLYYATKISLYHKNQADAESYWQRLTSRYPDSKEARKLKKYFAHKAKDKG
ncbi:MAG: outer membrane protein assembly factor BamD [Candidatus Cloacimonadaceae bacterium]